MYMMFWRVSLTHRHAFRRWMSTLVPSKGDTVVIAMSGGVDSSVAAKLLAEQDYDLSAVFMRNWDTRDESATDTGCEWEMDWEDVQRVCRMLSLPCMMVDLTREYWTRVFDKSLDVWMSGGTPNPDILCNREIKFGALLDRLTRDPRIGSSAWLATGHYARKSWSDGLPHQRPKLLRSADPTKDQTYYLSAISEESLRRTLFPLGGLTKAQVREIAGRHGLPTATRAESMGICFVGERRKFSDFISKYLTPNPGPIVDSLGKQEGTHQGLWNYTIGEGARLMGKHEKLFVAQKNPKLNKILVVPADDPALYRDAVLSTDFQWIWSDSPPPDIDQAQGFRAQAQFRHRMQEVPCTVRRLANNNHFISFDDPQKSVAPGQVVAIWKGDWCLGSGTISDT